MTAEMVRPCVLSGAVPSVLGEDRCWSLLASRVGEAVGAVQTYGHLTSDTFRGGSVPVRFGGYAAREWSGMPRSAWQKRTARVRRSEFWVWFLDPEDERDAMELVLSGFGL